MFWKNCQTVN